MDPQRIKQLVASAEGLVTSYPSDQKGIRGWMTDASGLVESMFDGNSLRPDLIDALAPSDVGRVGAAVRWMKQAASRFQTGADFKAIVLAHIDTVVKVLTAVAEEPARVPEPLGSKPVVAPSTKVAGSIDGRTFGRWRVLRHLKAGGQGEVFQVEPLEWSRRLGLGVLKRLSKDKLQDVKAARRLLREIATLKRLGHPCIVRVLGASTKSDDPWLVTEWAPLGSLQQNISFYAGDFWRVLRMARDLAAALQQAHERGIVHRDLKPQNILLRDVNWVALADFGIAHVDWDATLTSTDERVGARWFAPPEADQGRIKPTPAFDIYSLGKVIYFALSGGRTFQRESFHDPGCDLADLFPIPISARVNSELLGKMVVAKIGDRLQSMNDVMSAIDRVLCTTTDVADSRMVTGLGALPGPSLRPTVSAEVAKKATAAAEMLGDLSRTIEEWELTWNVEKGTGQVTAAEARSILAGFGEACLKPRLALNSFASQGILNVLDAALSEIRVLGRFEIFMDGGKSREEFFRRGDAVFFNMKGAAGSALAEVQQQAAP